ncbi:bacteriocin biosynthesis cyclodehydratase domain-containing protein [Curtobacterium luteum]|uniref:Bacteriocin biosynthesis cyclodehydratase domain-containing protein n=1 Tax=Curtobacterium luteum TaxID=33881 RepID=A0ABS2RP73_9MICO|nr:bacteriocin biosynthesis cyclodehydratase domain-containing protein [Curtobacterium luteum]
MGIRIDPTLEFVWRDPATVQLGVDPPRAVVPVPTTAEERFLCALRHETGRDALTALAHASGCRPELAAAVLAAASPAVVDVLPPTRPRVQVHGAGPLADTVAAQFEGEGVEVLRTLPPADGTGVEHGAGAAPPADDAQFAVVVAEHVVDPALRAAWSRRDVPHVAVVVGDGSVRVGPVVTPDAGPCLQCVEYDRADDDPAWPVLAAQVWGRSAAPLGPWRTAAVAATTVAIVLARVPSAAVARQRPDDDQDQLVLDRSDLSVTRRTLLPHPRCACRGLPGTDSESASPRGPTPVATTSPSPTDGPA